METQALIGGRRHLGPTINQQGAIRRFTSNMADFLRGGKRVGVLYAMQAKGGRDQPEMPRSKPAPGPMAISEKSWMDATVRGEREIV